MSGKNRRLVCWGTGGLFILIGCIPGSSQFPEKSVIGESSPSPFPVVMASSQPQAQPLGNPTPFKTASPQAVIEVIAGSGQEGFADGSGDKALFSYPGGLAIDKKNNIYVADGGNNRIRKIDPEGIVSTFAGQGTEGLKDGPRNEALFNGPNAVAFDTNGNLYITESNNHRLRKITPEGIVSTLAGSGSTEPNSIGVLEKGYKNGPGNVAQFSYPSAVTFDSDLNILYVLDGYIRKVTLDGFVSTLVNQKGQEFSGFSGGIVVDSQGNIFASRGDHVVAKITSQNQSTLIGKPICQTPLPLATSDYEDGEFAFAPCITTYVDGPSITARFYFLYGLAIDKQDNIYVADSGNHKIRKITPDGTVSTVIEIYKPYGLAMYGDNQLWVSQRHRILRIRLDLLPKN